MSDITELEQNLTDLEGIADQLLALIAANDARATALQDQIDTLIDAANISANEKAALAAKIDAAVAKSQALEDRERAAIPGVPPVGGTPLSPNYATRADFDAAVAAYTGVEQVTLDGSEVHAATDATATPAAYYSHSADGTVSTSGPTD